jgi:hypothetical protein
MCNAFPHKIVINFDVYQVWSKEYVCWVRVNPTSQWVTSKKKSLPRSLTPKFPRSQCCHQTINRWHKGADKSNIINIHQQIHSNLRMMKQKQKHVSSGWYKPMCTKSRSEMPCMHILFKPIQRLIETTLVLEIRPINTTWRLMHINFFL